MRKTSHVLVVDDNLDICFLIKDCLSEAGYRVSIAQNSNEMRRVIERSAVDFVLLDVILPQEDGCMLARSLRAEHSDLGIIIMTGGDKDIDQMVRDIGADDGLAKPFRMRELVARIQSIRRRAEEPATDQLPVGSK